MWTEFYLFGVKCEQHAEVWHLLAGLFGDRAVGIVG